MDNLTVILNRIRKMQSERELVDSKGLTNKEKWESLGFDHGLEWVENEIISLLKDTASGPHGGRT